MPNILSDTYEKPQQGTLENDLFLAQDGILHAFMLKTVDQNYWHLLQKNNTVRSQFNALKRHLDLGTHA